MSKIRQIVSVYAQQWVDELAVHFQIKQLVGSDFNERDVDVEDRGRVPQKRLGQAR